MKKTAVAKMFIVESEYLLWYLQDIFCIVGLNFKLLPVLKETDPDFYPEH